MEKKAIHKVFAVWNSSSLKAHTTSKYEMQDDHSANHAISQVIKCLLKQALISIKVWLLQFTSRLESFCFCDRNSITYLPFITPADKHFTVINMFIHRTLLESTAIPNSQANTGLTGTERLIQGHRVSLW